MSSASAASTWSRPLTYRRRRFRLLLLLLLGLFIYSIRSLLLASFQVLETPLIWSSQASQDLYISEVRDRFDITFQAYPRNITAASTSSDANSHVTKTDVAFPSPDLNNLKVPNIFHHILLGIKAKPSWLAARQSCIDYHPDYTFHLWTDENAVQFMRDEYPDHVDMWLNYRYPIQKADSLRYFVMLKYGGIFLDMDLQCERSLKPLQQFEVVAPAAHPMGVSNGFFMSAAQHPFLQRLVDNLKRFDRHWVFLPYPTVMLSTGCYYMSIIHATHPDRSNLRVLWGPNHLHRLSGNVTTPLFKHLGSSSWHSYDAAFFNFIGKPSKWGQIIAGQFRSQTNMVDGVEHATSGINWGMVSCCILGLVVGIYTGRHMSAKRKKMRRRKISFGTSTPRSVWAKYKSNWTKLAQVES